MGGCAILYSAFCFDALQIKIRHASDRVVLPATMLHTLSVMLAALAVPLGQAVLREGGEDPRVLEKLDTILAKLDEILKLMQTELKHQGEVRRQDQMKSQE
jgi:hypothetical protein